MLNVEQSTFGYLLIHADASLGWTGGYLIVSHTGRPIEFHCSEPVLPSRADEILYGATLRPHLCAERIAPALLAKASKRVDLLLVSDEETLRAGHDHGLPVVSLSAISAAEECGWESLGDEIAQRLMSFSDHVDIAEPFERVREAILEAHRVSHTGESDDQVAA